MSSSHFNYFRSLYFWINFGPKILITCLSEYLFLYPHFKIYLYSDLVKYLTGLSNWYSAAGYVRTIINYQLL